MNNIDWKAVYGPAPDALRTLVIDTLEQEEKPAARRRFSVAFVAALVLVLLAATAWAAIALNKSARYEAVTQAREAMVDYGFTAETLGFFLEEADLKDGEWTVRFLPIKYAERVGSYEVTVPQEGAAAVTWLMEGASLDETKGLDLGGEFWGPEQVSLLLEAETESLRRSAPLYAQKPNAQDWTLEELAYRDAPYVERGLTQANGIGLSLMPTEADITQEEAVRLAKKAILEKYGIDEVFYASYRQTVRFDRSGEDGSLQYRVYFSQSDSEDAYGFAIAVQSPSGSIIYCTWYPPLEEHTLPDGPLEDYPEAVREFFAHGAFDILSHSEKAQTGKRLIAAGYGGMINGFVYLDPADTGSSEDTAVLRAREALEARYGMDNRLLAMFEMKAAHIEMMGNPVWVVDFTPTIPFSVASQYQNQIGTYRAVIDGETYAAQRVSWSHDGDQPVETTGKTWGGARIWDASVLAYFSAFAEEVQALSAKREEAEDPSQQALEYTARLDALHREAGFTDGEYNATLPQVDDLPLEEARAIAESALLEAYGLAADAWHERNVRVSFERRGEDDRVWRFALLSTRGGNNDYYVDVSAVSGDVINVQYITTGNG